MRPRKHLSSRLGSSKYPKDIESAKWKTFRRQLRHDDRERLNKIFEYARMHADSGTVVSIPHKIDVVFMTVLIEMQRRVDELESALL